MLFFRLAKFILFYFQSSILFCFLLFHRQTSRTRTYLLYITGQCFSYVLRNIRDMVAVPITKTQSKFFENILIFEAISSRTYNFTQIQLFILFQNLKKKLAEDGLLHFENGAIDSLNPDIGVEEQADLLPYDRRWEFPREKLKFGTLKNVLIESEKSLLTPIVNIVR